MATVRSFTRAFSSGEVSPELFGHFDLARMAQAVATMRNFIALPHGPAANRTGTEFVKEVGGNSATKVRLAPFSYNNTQTFAIEVGSGFLRWHTLGATLLYTATAWVSNRPYFVADLVTFGGNTYACTVAVTSTTDPATDGAHWRLAAYNGATTYGVGDLVTSAGSTWYSLAAANTGNTPNISPTWWYALPADGTYEIPNPYVEAELFDIHYTQSADVLTLVHPSHPPLELRRYGPSNWQLAQPTFQPTISAPTAPVATPTGAGATAYSYVATAVSSTNNLEESVASSAASCNNDLTLAGHSNVLTCTAPSGAARVNWYKLANGLYGYIGQMAPGTSFTDANITADVSHTPPVMDAGFAAGSTTYPAAVGYFEQRRVFAGWSAGPQNLIATRSGTESNIGYHIPTLSDDRIAFRIAAREASAVRHIVPLQNLILLTATNEFKVASADGSALTGANVNVRPQAYVGANNVQPVVVNSTVLYAASRGGRVREMSYYWQGQSYQSSDISLMAPHLFDYLNVVDMTLAKAPYPILWCVNDAGALLGMTYVPEQQISAWHRHDTDGLFESCCAVSENGEDMLYLAVKRTINGAAKRYVERLHSRRAATAADSFYVDCGLTYSGAPVTTLSGLGHLEGKTVSILGDGAVMPQQVVTGGALPSALPAACSKIQLGLPITADLQTLPLAVDGIPDFGQGRQKNVNKVYLRVASSSSIFAGPSFTSLREFKQRTTEPYGSPPNLVSGEVEIVLDNAWGSSGQVCVRQPNPLPLTIVSATLDVAVGG